MPLASILTPNQFEVEVLTGVVIKTTSDACRACDELHERGVPIVVLTTLACLGWHIEGGFGVY